MLNDEQKQTFLNQLFELLGIPSISTLPEHKEDVLEAANWIKQYLLELGFTEENIKLLYAESLQKEDHHPVVFAQRVSDESLPTVLIYAHYDVQPVDPLEQWQSEPFEPQVRDGKIYARGANDNKGQLVSHLAALSLLQKEYGDNWPVNIKILFEGEEEAGGENIEALIEQFSDDELLKSDICLVADTPWVAAGAPTLLTALRGISYCQVNVKLAEGDLHSGEFGGAVRNPANALAYIISKLRDEQTGKVLIPGFYADVVELTATEKESLAAIPETEAEFLSNAKNAVAAVGEEDYTTMERKTSRPTLDVNGIWGGFQGEGAKTIIPAEAHAKISMRLVANQNPEEIAASFREYVQSIAPSGVEVDVEVIHNGDWVNAPIDSQYVKTAEAAMRETFAKEVIFAKEGGSIPAIAAIQKKLGAVPILMGYGLPDDSLHSPNEKFNLEQFYGGIACNYRFLTSLQK